MKYGLIVIIIASLLAMSGCGRRGALYLPEKDKPHSSSKQSNPVKKKQHDTIHKNAGTR